MKLREWLLLGLIIFNAIAMYGLKRTKLDLEAEVAILQDALDECETGSEIYRRALDETIDSKGATYWRAQYETWEANRFKKSMEVAEQ